MTDQEQYLWVQMFDKRAGDAEGSREWSVFHPDGSWLDDLTLPERFVFYTATSNHILGVQTDDFGVQYVRAFPILGR